MATADNEMQNASMQNNDCVTNGEGDSVTSQEEERVGGDEQMEEEEILGGDEQMEEEDILHDEQPEKENIVTSVKQKLRPPKNINYKY